MDLLLTLDQGQGRSPAVAVSQSQLREAQRISQAIHTNNTQGRSSRRQRTGRLAKSATAAGAQSQQQQQQQQQPPVWLTQMSNETNRSIAYMAQLIKGEAAH